MAQYDVFLSHNGKDKDVIIQIGQNLKERGLKVWLDVWELVPGRPWQEALEQIIQTTRTAAVFVGADGLGSWENREMRACLSEFVDRNLPVIPVMLPGLGQKPELPLFLKAFTWVDLRNGISKKGLDQLVWGISGKKPEDGDLISSSATPRRRLGQMNQAPPLPPHYVLRAEKVEALKALILDRGKHRAGALVMSAVHGLGGIGKSILAAALCSDIEVLDQFEDGVLWATLGRQPDILSILCGWIYSLGDHDFNPTTIQAASNHLRSLVRDKALLIVIDDVWESQHAKFLAPGSSRSRVLITTRRADVSFDLGADLYKLDVMDPCEAMTLLLSRYSGGRDGDQEQASRALCKLLGYLPLALELASARIAHGKSIREMCEALEQEIARLDVLESPKRRRKGGQQLQAVLNLSINALRDDDPKVWRSFIWLGLLPEDVLIHSTMAASFWGVDEEEASDVLEWLWNDALLLPGPVHGAPGNEKTTYRMHDLLADMTRKLMVSECPSGLGVTMQNAYRQVISRYRSRLCNGLWHTLPPDGHVHQYLTWYLEKAGLGTEIAKLLEEETEKGKNGWYLAREKLGQTAGYLEDLNRAWSLSSEQPDVGEMGELLRLALLSASIKSQFSNFSPQLLLDLEQCGLWSLSQSLAHARQLPGLRNRALALMGLSARCEGEQKDEILRNAMAYVIERKESDLALKLLDYLPMALASQLIDAFRGSNNDFLSGAALWLAEKKVYGKALVLANKIRDEHAWVDVMCRLIPVLPQKHLPSLLGKSPGDPRLYARLLTCLCPHLPESDHFHLLDLVESVSHRLGRLSVLVRLAEVADHSDKRREYLGLVHQIIEGIRKAPHRCRAVCYLLLLIPEYRTDEVFQEVFSFDLAYWMEGWLYNFDIVLQILEEKPVFSDDQIKHILAPVFWDLVSLGQSERVQWLFERLAPKQRVLAANHNDVFSVPSVAHSRLMKRLAGLEEPNQKAQTGSIPSQFSEEDRARLREAQISCRKINDTRRLAPLQLKIVESLKDNRHKKKKLNEILEYLRHSSNSALGNKSQIFADLSWGLLECGDFESAYLALEKLTPNSRPLALVFQLLSVVADFQRKGHLFFSICEEREAWPLSLVEERFLQRVVDEVLADMMKREGFPPNRTAEPGQVYRFQDRLIRLALKIFIPELVRLRQWDAALNIVEPFYGEIVDDALYNMLSSVPEAFRERVIRRLFRDLSTHAREPGLERNLIFRLTESGYATQILKLIATREDRDRKPLAIQLVKAMIFHEHEPDLVLETVFLLKGHERDELLDEVFNQYKTKDTAFALKGTAFFSDETVRFHRYIELARICDDHLVISEEIEPFQKASEFSRTLPTHKRLDLWLEAAAESEINHGLGEQILEEALQAALAEPVTELRAPLLLRVADAGLYYEKGNFCFNALERVEPLSKRLDTLIELFPDLARLDEERAFTTLWRLSDEIPIKSQNPLLQDMIDFFCKAKPEEANEVKRFFTHQAFTRMTSMDTVLGLARMNLPERAAWAASRIKNPLEKVLARIELAWFFRETRELEPVKVMEEIQDLDSPGDQGKALEALIGRFYKINSVLSFVERTLESLGNSDDRDHFSARIGQELSKRGLHSAAVSIAAHIRSKALRSEILLGMAGNAPFEHGKALVDGIPYSRTRDEAKWVLIRRHVSQLAPDEALAWAGVMKDPFYKCQALALVAFLLSGKSGKVVARESFELACRLDFFWERFPAMLTLVECLPDSYRSDAARETVKALALFPSNLQTEMDIVICFNALLNSGEPQYAVQTANLSQWRQVNLLKSTLPRLLETDYQDQLLKDDNLHGILPEQVVRALIKIKEWEKAWHILKNLGESPKRLELLKKLAWKLRYRNLSLCLDVVRELDNGGITPQHKLKLPSDLGTHWRLRDGVIAEILLTSFYPIGQLENALGSILKWVRLIEDIDNRLKLICHFNIRFIFSAELFDVWWQDMESKRLWRYLSDFNGMALNKGPGPVEKGCRRLLVELEEESPDVSQLGQLGDVMSRLLPQPFPPFGELVNALVLKVQDREILTDLLTKVVRLLPAGECRGRIFENLINGHLNAMRETGTSQTGLLKRVAVTAVELSMHERQRIWRSILRGVSAYERSEVLEILPEIISLAGNSEALLDAAFHVTTQVERWFP